MINITKMLAEFVSYGDRLRYHSSCKDNKHGTRRDTGPVVVWNFTGKCNLKCKHCYANAREREKQEVLSTEEGLKLIDDLASFNVPVLLLSGGEPFIRSDLFTLIERAQENKIRVVISSNGTLINSETARRIKNLGVSYVGISLDGMEAINDKFRGVDGAFNRALNGIRNCLAQGQKVGLRFTINRHNYREIDSIFNLIDREKIPRVCFYHLVYSGRGREIQELDLTAVEKRETIDRIIDRAREFIDKGEPREILTVDNHADGAYLYLKKLAEDPEQAGRIYEMLLLSGGNRSGIAIANIDHRGDVHPDQFSTELKLGNIREKSFAEIWTDPENELLGQLRQRKELLQGRCRNCRFLEICNGNFRIRALATTGNLWAPDPGCYLSDEEIGGNIDDRILEYNK